MGLVELLPLTVCFVADFKSNNKYYILDYVCVFFGLGVISRSQKQSLMHEKMFMLNTSISVLHYMHKY